MTEPTRPDLPATILGGVRWCATPGCVHVACDMEHDHAGTVSTCRGAYCPVCADEGAA